MLSIIYINYYGYKFILQSIQSLYRYGLQMSHQIIIVNNSAEDKSIYDILKFYPQTQIIETGYNAGFARANNLGIKNAKGDIVLLLNGDTYVTDNSIDLFYEDFKKSSYAAAAPQLYYVDNTPQLSAFTVPLGGLNTLLPLPVLGKLIKSITTLLKIKKTYSTATNNAVIAADWVHGACLMFKKEIIEKVGALDEDFFLYSEEIEWCSRIRKKYTLALFSQYKVIHLEGASSTTLFKNTDKGYYDVYTKKGLQLMLSNWVRIRKEFGVGWFLFHISFYFLEVPLQFIFKIFTPALHPVAFAKNVFYLFGKAFIIIKNKPYFYKV